MNDPAQKDPAREERLSEALADYLQRLDRGEAVDRREFLHRYAELAEDLQEVFDAADLVEEMAGPPLPNSPPDTPQLRFDQATHPSPPDPLGTIAPTQAFAESSELPQRPVSESTAPSDNGSEDLFGVYELLEEIGRGGMGVVYKARQVRLDRIVAIKMVRSARLVSDADVQRFYAEAQTAGKLKHPHIVAVHQVGEIDGKHFYSMDYIEGESLAQRTRRGPLPAEEAAQLLKTIAEAVQYAHDNGVLHRDLKPANILIDTENQANVTDFGLAKRLEEKAGLTLPGSALGTPGYMSPEQAQGRLEVIGPATDVYGLGAILYEMLTGKPPFHASSPVDTLCRVVHDEPKRPRAINPEASRDLETICLKCLHKDPRRRYASAQEVADEVDRFLRGEPIRAKPAGVLARGWRWVGGIPLVAALTCRRPVRTGPWQRRVQTALNVLLALALLGSIAWALWPERLPSRIRIAAGRSGGVYHPFSEYFGDLLQEQTGRPVEVIDTDGSLENADLLLSGKVELACLQSSTFSASDLRIVAPLYYEKVFVIVRKGRGIDGIADLAGKAVSLGPEGSGMRHSAAKVLDYYGLDPASLSKTDRYFAELLDDETMDGAIVTIGSRNSADLDHLLLDARFALLPLKDAEKLANRNECFEATHLVAGDLPADMPGRAEFPAEGIPTVMTPAFLVVHAKAGDLLVETTLRALYHDSDLVRRLGLIPLDEARQWKSWPLHPAARRFFETAD